MNSHGGFQKRENRYLVGKKRTGKVAYSVSNTTIVGEKVATDEGAIS